MIVTSRFYTSAKRHPNAIQTAPHTNKKEKNDNNNIPFEDFWNSYDKKVGRKSAAKKWEKLSLSDKQKIILHVPQYVAATPDEKYRKNPLTYLNQEVWLDEGLPNRKKELRLNFSNL